MKLLTFSSFELRQWFTDATFVGELSSLLMENIFFFFFAETTFMFKSLTCKHLINVLREKKTSKRKQFVGYGNINHQISILKHG
jgi:hypothetical protein